MILSLKIQCNKFKQVNSNIEISYYAYLEKTIDGNESKEINKYKTLVLFTTWQVYTIQGDFEIHAFHSKYLFTSIAIV